MKKPLIALLVSLAFSSFNIINSQLWKQYADSAKVFSGQKNTDKTLEFYSKAEEELKKDSFGTINYAIICDTLGVLFLKKKQYEKAEFVLLKAKEIRETIEGKDNLDYAKTCYNLAVLYRNMVQYQRQRPIIY